MEAIRIQILSKLVKSFSSFEDFLAMSSKQPPHYIQSFSSSTLSLVWGVLSDVSIS